jgi:uncharacterized membrane protein
MKRIFAVAALVTAFGVAPAIASEANTDQVSIEKQMRELKKKAGAGEISSKEYNKRLAELREAAKTQQTAETPKK